MIIWKNENADLISHEIEDPEGLKPYQRKWLANKARVDKERWIMRMNAAKHKQVTPKMLQDFELPITEENESDQSQQRLNEMEAYEYINSHIISEPDSWRDTVKQQVLSFPMPETHDDPTRRNSDFNATPSRVSRSGAFSSNENLDYINHVQ